MRSRPFSVRLPHPVRKGAERRQKSLKFKSLGDYLVNLVRCDLIMQRGHDWTQWFAGRSEAVQAFMDECLEDFEGSEPGSQHSLIGHFCQGIIEVQMARHHCSAKEALNFLPSDVRALCESRGFG